MLSVYEGERLERGPSGRAVGALSGGRAQCKLERARERESKSR